MMPGIVFVGSALYLTLVVALVITLLDTRSSGGFIPVTLIRWGKLVGGLAVLGMVVQVLTCNAHHS